MRHHTKQYSVVIKNNCICLYLVMWGKSAMCSRVRKASYKQPSLENIHWEKVWQALHQNLGGRYPSLWIYVWFSISSGWNDVLSRYVIRKLYCFYNLKLLRIFTIPTGFKQSALSFLGHWRTSNSFCTKCVFYAFSDKQIFWKFHRSLTRSVWTVAFMSFFVCILPITF